MTEEAAEKMGMYQSSDGGFHSPMGYEGSMRGNDEQEAAVFSYINAEDRIPADHPLRRIRAMVDGALEELWGHFEALYARRGRPSIAPEKLLRALLLQILYSIRSERQLMDQINFNLLYRWFVGLNPDDAIWDATVFSKNREQLLQGEVSQRLLVAVVEQARAQGLLSEEHFTVDGTLIEAWASRKSFVPKDEPPTRGTGARGRKLLRDTHESTSDPQARLYKKSTAGEAKPSYLGHVIIENRNGLVVAACATQSSAKAEREAALAMLDARGMGSGSRRITLGADKHYQEQKFIAALRQRNIAPHVAEYEKPSPQWPNFLTEAERNDAGRAISQKKRKLVEKVFGWAKLDSILGTIKLRGKGRVDWLFRLLAAANNLVRMVKLIPAQ
jgi:transposase